MECKNGLTGDSGSLPGGRDWHADVCTAAVLQGITTRVTIERHYARRLSAHENDEKYAHAP